MTTTQMIQNTGLLALFVVLLLALAVIVLRLAALPLAGAALALDRAADLAATPLFPPAVDHPRGGGTGDRR
ncbi:hypothetical protein PWG71_27960 [Nocardiopsis sp. N85]|uniref:hypothetical protein n=1 Tax=Nocardiopsis sp. N85 TaxID=3029400 RepID=UPI00237F613C|nr:hypothetical protein [Nocardiopsis sp. N85]MDE3725233.1 hypothetical protein [Nocardiopsis sp. N85]